MPRKIRTKAKSESATKKRTAGDIIFTVFFWLIAAGASAYAILMLVGYITSEDKSPKATSEKNRYRLTIFNGCRDSRVTLDVVDLLRNRGDIDVVEIEKSPNYVFPKTLVLDRAGDGKKAVEIASMLGLDKDACIKQISPGVDATLIIGLDYPILMDRLKGKNGA